MPDQVRHDGKGLSFRNAPALSSRSASIRDLALLALSKERRCRIRSGMTGRSKDREKPRFSRSRP